jgi:anti-anti-sigma factor
MKVFYPTRILSSANAPDLISWIQENLEAGTDQLLVNFQNVLFMDSTGLATLVTALRMVEQAGGRLALCSLSGQARMLFEIASMEKLFEIYGNPSELHLNTN